MKTVAILLLSAAGALAQMSMTSPFYTASVLSKTLNYTYTTNAVTNTWDFGVAQLADQAFNSSIGLSVAGGTLNFGCTANSVSGIEYGLTNNNTHTWQTWGVPSTGTVVAVCLAGWQGVIVRTNKLTGIGWRLAVINAASNAVHSSTWLYMTNVASPWTTNINPADLSVSNAWVDVPWSTNQASDAQVRLLFVLGGTNGTSSVVWTNKFDNVKVGIKYYGAAPL